MPCNSNHLEPTHREQELQRAARLLLFTQRCMAIKPADSLIADVAAAYCSHDYTATLCAVIKGMEPKQLSEIVYNGYNKDSRDLADWWEEHQKADAKRAKEETTSKAIEHVLGTTIYNNAKRFLSPPELLKMAALDCFMGRLPKKNVNKDIWATDKIRTAMVFLADTGGYIE